MDRSNVISSQSTGGLNSYLLELINPEGQNVPVPMTFCVDPHVTKSLLISTSITIPPDVVEVRFQVSFQELDLPQVIRLYAVDDQGRAFFWQSISWDQTIVDRYDRELRQSMIFNLSQETISTTNYTLQGTFQVTRHAELPKEFLNGQPSSLLSTTMNDKFTLEASRASDGLTVTGFPTTELFYNNMFQRPGKLNNLAYDQVPLFLKRLGSDGWVGGVPLFAPGEYVLYQDEFPDLFTNYWGRGDIRAHVRFVSPAGQPNVLASIRLLVRLFGDKYDSTGGYQPLVLLQETILDEFQTDSDEPRFSLSGAVSFAQVVPIKRVQLLVFVNNGNTSGLTPIADDTSYLEYRFDEYNAPGHNKNIVAISAQNLEPSVPIRISSRLNLKAVPGAQLSKDVKAGVPFPTGGYNLASALFTIFSDPRLRCAYTFAEYASLYNYFRDVSSEAKIGWQAAGLYDMLNQGGFIGPSVDKIYQPFRPIIKAAAPIVGRLPTIASPAVGAVTGRIGDAIAWNAQGHEESWNCAGIDNKETEAHPPAFTIELEEVESDLESDVLTDVMDAAQDLLRQFIPEFQEPQSVQLPIMLLKKENGVISVLPPTRDNVDEFMPDVGNDAPWHCSGLKGWEDEISEAIRQVDLGTGVTELSGGIEFSQPEELNIPEATISQSVTGVRVVAEQPTRTFTVHEISTAAKAFGGFARQEAYQGVVGNGRMGLILQGNKGQVVAIKGSAIRLIDVYCSPGPIEGFDYTMITPGFYISNITGVPDLIKMSAIIMKIRSNMVRAGMANIEARRKAITSTTPFKEAPTAQAEPPMYLAAAMPIQDYSCEATLYGLAIGASLLGTIISAGLATVTFQEQTVVVTKPVNMAEEKINFLLNARTPIIISVTDAEFDRLNKKGIPIVGSNSVTAGLMHSGVAFRVTDLTGVLRTLVALQTIKTGYQIQAKQQSPIASMSQQEAVETLQKYPRFVINMLLFSEVPNSIKQTQIAIRNGSKTEGALGKPVRDTIVRAIPAWAEAKDSANWVKSMAAQAKASLAKGSKAKVPVDRVDLSLVDKYSPSNVEELVRHIPEDLTPSQKANLVKKAKGSTLDQYTKMISDAREANQSAKAKPSKGLALMATKELESFFDI